MPVRAIGGYIPGSQMPPHLAALLGPIRPFSDARPRLAAMAVSGSGTDHVLPNEPDCFDQNSIGSCVCNAYIGALACLLAIEGLPFTMLSRLFLYWLCRLYMGTLNEDSGTYVHLAIERAGTIGVCPESMWQYGTQYFLGSDGKAILPSPQCFPAASDNKPTAWFSIPDGDPAALDDIETAIRANHPVQFGSAVDSTIQTYQLGQVLTTPNPNNIIGGHSMVVTGVKYINGKRVWWIRNSWGVDWGDNGHCLVDDAFMSQANDRWVLTRVDPLLFN